MIDLMTIWIFVFIITALIGFVLSEADASAVPFILFIAAFWFITLPLIFFFFTINGLEKLYRRIWGP